MQCIVYGGATKYWFFLGSPCQGNIERRMLYEGEDGKEKERAHGSREAYVVPNYDVLAFFVFATLCLSAVVAAARSCPSLSFRPA